MERESESISKHRDCLKCPYMPCINLYNDAEGMYGELYVLNKYRSYGIPPCSIGVLLYALCYLIRYINEKYQNPALGLYIQGLRDFKASIILLFTGHYRASIALLRSVLEMFLVGIHFDSRFFSTEDEAEMDKVISEIEDFLNERYEVPEEVRLLAKKPHKKKLDHSLILEYLMQMGGIYEGYKGKLGKLKNRIEELVSELNGYIHAKRLEVIKPSCPPCPAAVMLDREEYETCIKFMQTTFSLIVGILFITFITEEHLKDRELWEETLLWVTWIEEVQKDIKRKLIFSKYLETLVNDLKVMYRECYQHKEK